MANSYHVDAEDMAWHCHRQAGVSFKTLRFESSDKSGAVMVHMCPGAAYPEYVATHGQDVLVVDGELTFGDERLRRGAYIRVAAGEPQRPVSENGCVLFVTFPGAIEHR